MPGVGASTGVCKPRTNAVMSTASSAYISSKDIDGYFADKIDKDKQCDYLVLKQCAITSQEEMYIPPCCDHVLTQVHNGCVSGNLSFNGEKSTRFDQCDSEWVLGQCYENSMRGDWQAYGDGKKPLAISILSLKPELLDQVAIESAVGCSASIELPHQRGFKDPFLKQLVLSIQQNTAYPPLYNDLYMETVSTMLAVHLLQHYSSRKAVVKEYGKRHSRNSIKRAIDYVNSSLNQKISLNAMACEANMSSYHFARLFKKITGLTPYQYVIKVKIKRACYLLRNTDTPVSLIAEKLGYNANHFSKVFKQFTGYSPSQYRELC